MSSTMPPWSSSLRLHAYRCRTVGVAASSKTLRSHMSIPVSSLGQVPLPTSLFQFHSAPALSGSAGQGRRQSHGQVLTEGWNAPALYTKPTLQNLAGPLSPVYPMLPTSLKPSLCLVSKMSARFLFLNYFLFFPGLPVVPECRPLGYLHTHTP